MRKYHTFTTTPPSRKYILLVAMVACLMGWMACDSVTRYMITLWHVR